MPKKKFGAEKLKAMMVWLAYYPMDTAPITIQEN